MLNIINHIRRNHALEHATINLVSQRHPQAHVVGLSGPQGFTLYTNLTTEEIIPAIQQALKRLQAGESNLRIHANCGTNLVVTAILTVLATIVGLGYETDFSPRKRWERIPQTILLNVVALLMARPLGHWTQTYMTTNPHLNNVEIASIFTDYQGNARRIRVHTRQS